MAQKSEKLGVVVGNKMQKSIVVAVEWQGRHGLYGKTERRTSKFMVHDENGEAKIGDLVEIVDFLKTPERYAAIVEEWKALPRADRTQEQELWARLSAARTAFDKARRTHFTALEAQRKLSLGAKRDLIAQAEALAASTNWAATARRLRDLMADWKAAPRGSKSDEDRLWKRFKAAQDAFYAARTAAEDAEQEAHHEVLRSVAMAGHEVGNHTNTFPPVNVVRVEDFKYNIELAVAGYKMEEIEITAAKNSLKIEGKKADKDERTYIVKGIAGRSFTRHFVLADTVVVRDAVLADGILTISLENVIPEEQKPHKVVITTPKATKK